jgi:uncharacterized NAD(P)/FAD-binding protein YdhS
MTAAQILRRTGTAIHISLIERRGAVGEGLAYATREQAHLLKVPAGRMSAWPDRSDDFLEWALRIIGESCGTGPGEQARLSIIFDEVRRVARHPGGGWMVHLERGSSLRADAVVLAIGHRPPSDPIGRKWIGPRTRLIADPWRPFAMNVVRPDDGCARSGRSTVTVWGSPSPADFKQLSMAETNCAK